MTTQVILDGQHIILRQEIILPAPWLATSPTAFPVQAEPNTAYTSACSQAGLRDYLTLDVRVTAPAPGSTVYAPSSLITVQGHSDLNGIGAREVHVKCYRPQDVPADPYLGTIPTDPDVRSIKAPSGSVLARDWSIPNVFVKLASTQNTVLAWSVFLGDPVPKVARSTFTIGIGSGLGTWTSCTAMGPGLTGQLAPPHELLLTTPDTNETVLLQYDDFCSSPEQPVWASESQSASCWFLKACLYGDRLIGILSNRSDMGCPAVWITDCFSFDAVNQLTREGMPQSVATISPRPATSCSVL